MTKKEFINHGTGGKDDWICVCGNTDVAYGFYPCNSNGKKIEPDRGVWKGLYICDKCGRIIKQSTREVVGRKKLTMKTK